MNMIIIKIEIVLLSSRLGDQYFVWFILCGEKLNAIHMEGEPINILLYENNNERSGTKPLL